MGKWGLLKITLCVINTLILFCAITVITASAVMFIIRIHLGGFSLTIGIVTAIIALVGGYAAIAEHCSALCMYIFMLFTIVVLQLVLGAIVTVWTEQGRLKDYFTNIFESHWKDPKNKQKKRPVDFIENFFRCCGCLSPEDWLRRNFTYPDSCFNAGTFYNRACYWPFRHFVVYTLGLLTMFLITLEFAGAALACFFRTSLL